MRDVAIITGCRTPFGKGGKGWYKDVRPDDMGIAVVQEVMRHTRMEPQEIGDVVLGCAMPEAEQGMNVARIVALGAGLPVEVPAMTVNRFCASGVQSIAHVADRITLGQIEAGIAGGVESMSMVPMTGNKISLNPGLVEQMPQIYTPMGVTAENIARTYGISREEQDLFSYQSHQKTLKARNAGYFRDEITTLAAVSMRDGNYMRTYHYTDENVREDTTPEKLAALQPAFDPTGTVTAGNSSPLTDGAAAVLLTSAERAHELDQPILGYFRSFAVAGVPPEMMGTGPVPAIRKLLQQTNLTIDQIDLFEINEAFASQVLYCVKELQIPMEKLNVNGGAIAIGHPLGVTGTRLVHTILRQLNRQQGRYGIVSMCVGGGMGAAALVERI